MTNDARMSPGLDSSEVYQALGPLTTADRRYLGRMTPAQRTRWFSNIYGRTAARYARHQYRAGVR